MKYFVVLFVLVSTAVAQSPVYGQCGGTGWTGATTCASGSVCTYSNPYYSQCLPGSVPPPTTTVKTITTAAPTTTATSSSASGTVYLAGDSTMASGGGGTGTDGWGQYLAQYLTIPVINDAVAGRSARSYTFEGRFTTIINAVKAGDFVVIEFGHNDGTSNPDNGRSDAVGDDYTTTATVTAADGTTTLVHTYGYYVENAVNSLKAKGATAIVSSSTPDNIWPLTLNGGSRFQGYAKDAAKNVSAPYVDHFAYVAQAYIALGEDTVNTYYPIDHTHTSPTGANVVAEAFVRGLICGGSVLSQRVNAAGKAAPNGCISS